MAAADISLFYFADESVSRSADRYHLLLEGARFADAHGFTAVWTPERHFHPFGGNYPNPAGTSAAVAAVTDRVAVRAGSVVAPLHRVEQIAEDWWLLDSLSRGRTGISLASGWNRGDFVLNPHGAPGAGHVTLMLHTYVGHDAAQVESVARRPLEDYLMSAMNLMRPKDAAQDTDGRQDRRARLAVQPAYEKYLRGGRSLIGTVEQAASVAREFGTLGVDEIACLIDFGVPPEATMDGLAALALLRAEVAA